jgi:hypothetical protein
MKRIASLIATLALAASFAACGSQTAQQACADHGGLRANSIEADAHNHDGDTDDDPGAEGRCNDGAEVEKEGNTDPNTGYWTAED